jgi:CRP-like cAMP-binding protein
MDKFSTILPDLEMIRNINGFFEKFLPLSGIELAELVKYCRIRQFPRKTILIEEGEIDNYLNLVVKGLVMKYIRMTRGEMILQLATEGHVISAEISFLTRHPSDVVVETLEPTTMVSISYDNMMDALDNFTRGEELGRRILEDMYVKKDEKKYLWLSMGVRERFIHYLKNHPHMLQRVPQKYLASYLNIKPETFSRLKHLMRVRPDKKNRAVD